jgi:hypothetical protein
VSTEAATALWKSGAIAPLKPLLEPFAVRRSPALEAALATLERAYDALLSRWAEGDPALPTIPLPENVREAALRDVRAGRRLLFSRFDVACPSDAPEGFALLELQAGDPSAMGYCDLLSRAFGLPETLMRSHRLQLERQTAGRRIAFVLPDQALLRADTEALAAHYRAHGWKARIVDPARLRFDGAHLLADGAPVDAVYRDALDELFPAGAALLEAHAAQKVTVANPFAAAVADDKAWLEVLSTAAHWDDATWATLRRHVPCTRVVSERTVDWHGERVELVPFLRANRARLVLKPCEGFGGYGVVVGPFVTAEVWTEAVLRALSGQRTVVQEYVALPRHRVRWLDEAGSIHHDEAFVVHSFWQHAGRLAGGFVRASSAPVVNVHQGGGLGVFQLEPPLE